MDPVNLVYQEGGKSVRLDLDQATALLTQLMQTAKRVMIFYFGNQFGQASAKLLAFGILHMRGVAGRPGYKQQFKHSVQRIMLTNLQLVLAVCPDGRLHLSQWLHSRLLSSGLVQEAKKHFLAQCQDL